MHFLASAQHYWHNPDINSVQIFGKDIRSLLIVSCQKLFFEPGHTYYHYGPVEIPSSYRNDCDLQLANYTESGMPFVSQAKSTGVNNVVITDRVYE